MLRDNLFVKIGEWLKRTALSEVPSDVRTEQEGKGEKDWRRKKLKPLKI